MKREVFDYFVIAFISILLIFATFEVVLLGVAFFGADKVKCNLLWCTFTTERQSDTIIIETHKTCFLNGYEIDCNDNRTNLPKILTSGNFDRKPTFKYDKDWIDVLENTNPEGDNR